MASNPIGALFLRAFVSFRESGFTSRHVTARACIFARGIYQCKCVQHAKLASSRNGCWLLFSLLLFAAATVDHLTQYMTDGRRDIRAPPRSELKSHLIARRTKATTRLVPTKEAFGPKLQSTRFHPLSERNPNSYFKIPIKWPRWFRGHLNRGFRVGVCDKGL